MDNTPQDQAPQFNTPAPLPLQSGSRVLDQLFARGGLTTGAVRHLCGGDRLFQRLIALLMCSAACERGERAVLINLGYHESDFPIDDTVRTPFFNARRLSDPARAFRLLSPKTAGEVEALIVELARTAAERGERLTIAVDYAERAFEPQARALSPDQSAAALATFARWCSDFALLCQQTGLTLWLNHSDNNKEDTLFAAVRSPFKEEVMQVLPGTQMSRPAPTILELGDSVMGQVPGPLGSSIGSLTFALSVRLWMNWECIECAEHVIFQPDRNFDNAPPGTTRFSAFGSASLSAPAAAPALSVPSAPRNTKPARGRVDTWTPRFGLPPTSRPRRPM